MNRSLLPVLLLSFLAAANAQNTYQSLGGFGNVVYPGTGHAPNAAFLSSAYGVGRAGGGGSVHGGGAANHSGGHPRTVIVPYPLYYGNYYGSGYYDPSAAGAPPQDQGNQAPSVVINQTFIPERPNPVVQEYGDPNSGMKLYQGPPGPYQQPDGAAPARARVPSDEATVYLIAFKDHSIVQALGYWMEGGVLHYVSAEHSLNQASLDLIDRALSQRLNDERGVEFKLPAR